MAWWEHRPSVVTRALSAQEVYIHGLGGALAVSTVLRLTHQGNLHHMHECLCASNRPAPLVWTQIFLCDRRGPAFHGAHAPSNLLQGTQQGTSTKHVLVHVAVPNSVCAFAKQLAMRLLKQGGPLESCS